MTLSGWLSTKVQVLPVLPLQSLTPLQLAKVEPLLGVAVRVTVVATGKVAPHVLPQSIPTGELVTVPLPLPAFATERVVVGHIVV